jgi:protein ImuA
MGGTCQHLQIEALRQQLAQWEGAAAWQNALADPASPERVPVLSSGCPALDGILPEKGFRRGTLVEWLGDGAATLAFRTAAGACQDGRALVVVDSSGEFYPPAAIALGIEPSRLIVVHPGNKADHTWALDQALRCPAVAAAVAWPDCTHHAPRGDGLHRTERGEYGYTLDGRTFRRLQLAVEQGGGLGLLIRPTVLRGEPSWTDVRLLVEPLASNKDPFIARRRMRIVLLRCRGGRGEQSVEVEIDDELHPLP